MPFHISMQVNPKDHLCLVVREVLEERFHCIYTCIVQTLDSDCEINP